MNQPTLAIKPRIVTDYPIISKTKEAVQNSYSPGTVELKPEKKEEKMPNGNELEAQRKNTAVNDTPKKPFNFMPLLVMAALGVAIYFLINKKGGKVEVPAV